MTVDMCAEPPAVGLSGADLVAARPALLRSVRQRLTNSVEDAEDITQEAMARAWNARILFDTSRPLQPWLFTIAKRVAIDDSRRRRVTFVDPIKAEDGEGVLEQVADSRPGPDVDVVRDDLRNGIRAATGVISERYRRVLSRRVVDQMSYDEIAEAEGITAAAVKPTLSRARSQFTDAYLATGMTTRIGAWIGGMLFGIRRHQSGTGGATSTGPSGTAAAVSASGGGVSATGVFGACCTTVALVAGMALLGEASTWSAASERDGPMLDASAVPFDVDDATPTATDVPAAVNGSAERATVEVRAPRIEPGPSPDALNLSALEADIKGDEDSVTITNTQRDPTSDESKEGPPDNGGEATIECIDPGSDAPSCQAIALIGPLLGDG